MERELEVDATEFLRNVTPAAKRSRLAPYWNEVVKLRDNDCTLVQVCCFLQKNGVQISIAGLSKYIKRRNFLIQEERTGAQSTNKAKTAVARHADQGASQRPVVAPLAGGDGDTEIAGPGLSLKQRREMRADEFIKSENTVLNKLGKKRNP